MRKRILFLIGIISFFNLKASHEVGGTIGWECLNNGEYRFTMEIYRDCAGFNSPYQNENLSISGAPLPTDTLGLFLSGIQLQPDSAKWNNNNNGDFSARCNNGGGLDCSQGEGGTTRIFWYISDPVELNGIPPASGWTFSWQASSFRGQNITNLSIPTTSKLGLQVKMYPFQNRNVNPCYDSSPIFKSAPEFSICRDYEFTYNASVLDRDIDSIVTNTDFAYDQFMQGGVLNPVSFTSPYTRLNPTPSPNQNVNNVPYSLDPITGLVRFGIYSGSGTERFVTPIRVDTYREGELIASIYRESQASMLDCPDLLNRRTNLPAVVFMDGIPTQSLFRVVNAGQALSIPVQIVDNDLTNFGNGLQTLTLTPRGSLLTTNKGPNTDSTAITLRQKGSPCAIPGLEPCAYFQGRIPVIDTIQKPSAYSIRGIGAIQTEFVWQTDCKHVQSNRGAPGTNSSIYSFVMKVIDDHCPLPTINYPTIMVRVNDPIPLTEPIMKGISVNLDGSVQFNWIPPIDSATQFKKYKLEGTRVDLNSPLGNWVALNLNVGNYEKNDIVANFPVYELVDSLGPLNGMVNLLSPLKTTQGIDNDFYMRMQTVSGCSDTITSSFSEPAQVMRLNGTAVGLGLNPRDSIQLTWNRTKPLNAQTYHYLQYERPTTFYIYGNDSITQSGLRDSLNWYLIGSTLDTVFPIFSNSCNQHVAYRVEARDTVGTFKQGSSLNPWFLVSNELTYSAFSLIDTVLVGSSKPMVRNVNDQYLMSNLDRGEVQWINCTDNSPILGATNKNFIPTESGGYRVVVAKDLNVINCNDTSDCFFVDSIDNRIQIFAIDSVIALDTLSILQWSGNCGDSAVIITGEGNQKFIPFKAGDYQLNLQYFGVKDTSICFTAPIINDSIEIVSNQELIVLDTGKYYQWVNCNTGLDIPGETSRVLIVSDTGIYAVKISAFGYSKISECIEMYAVGIEEYPLQNRIALFPNPNPGVFYLKGLSFGEEYKIEIRNVQGQLIQERIVSNQQQMELNLENEVGIYFVQLTNRKGEQANFKVVKQ